MIVKSYIKFACLFLLISLSFYSFSQNIIVTGQVIDDDTEEALPFCNIILKGSSLGLNADIDGNYVIEIDPNLGDSIIASSLGYVDQIKALDKSKSEQQINFRLRSSSMDLGVEVVVNAGENPANRIIRNINKNKKTNNILNAAKAFESEVYTKTELDLVNITPDMKDMKIFKKLQFIFENIDSVSDVKPFLPAYVAENITERYFVNGFAQKDILTAQRVSGVKNQTVIDFIGRMNEEYNIYNNTLKLLGKEFISPFSINGLSFYNYYILDSTFIKDKWSYKLKFKPKDKTGNTFYGDFWVSMDDYALAIVNMRMNPEANINLVNRIIIYQEYNHEDNIWIPYKQKTVIDFAANENEKGLGIIGRKTTSFKDFLLNNNETIEMFKLKDPEEVKYETLEKADTFWSEKRHEPLTKNETGVYKMVDSIQNIPLFKTVADVVEIIVSGYKEWGPIKIGPYSNLFTWNDVEGPRFSLGIGTSVEFSKKFQIYGYAGYGIKDRKWKYGGTMQYVFNRYRRSAIGIEYFDDATFESRSSEIRKTQSLFAGFLRRNIPQKIMYVKEGKIWFKHTWKRGFSNKIALMHRRVDPVGYENTRMGGFNFKFLSPNPESPSSFDTLTRVNTTEMILKFRYAYKEKLISGPFRDFSMGSKFPIIELTYTLGVKGIIQSQFNYHKLRLNISHWFYTSPVGYIEYQVEAGKIFGTLPYLLLETHPGNEAYFYNKTSFNSMNSFEFVSDFYVHARLEHHWDGFILNRIPFIRKYLRWRLVTAVRATWGTLSKANFEANKLNHYDRNIKRSKDRPQPFTEGPFYGSFDKGPFSEVSIGIENILNFIRVDALWRITYLDNRDAQPFSVRVTLNFSF